MRQLTLEDARELSDWLPPFGVVSIYLGFDPADRGKAWRTELGNGVEAAMKLAENADHERKLAVRETGKRLLERFDDAVRPPPLGEVGFVEVSRDGGREHWWETGTAPVLPAVVFAEAPVLTEMVDLCRRGDEWAVALISAERVRLLRYAEENLEELEEWELSIASLAWRERKAQSPRDPARTHGVSSSGRDRYEERLEHNRHRFLVECGRRVGERSKERGLDRLVAFGPRRDAEAVWKGIEATQMRTELGGEEDLVSKERGELRDEVAGAIAGLLNKGDREVVERALEEVRSGSRGAAGLQETAEALAERRVEHLVLGRPVGFPTEALVRGALAGGAEISVVHDGAAGLLEPAEGVAAILRY
jgi:hypothetical protein